jgi:hypothetical protein
MDSSDSARAVAAIARIDAVPTLLKALCEMTGMRVAVVARVTDKTWTACAVKDEAHFGLKPGMELAVNTTLCCNGVCDQGACIEEGYARRRHRMVRLFSAPRQSLASFADDAVSPLTYVPMPTS